MRVPARKLQLVILRSALTVSARYISVEDNEPTGSQELDQGQQDLGFDGTEVGEHVCRKVGR